MNANTPMTYKPQRNMISAIPFSYTTCTVTALKRKEKAPTFRINMNHPAPPLFTSLRPLPLIPLVFAFIAACFPSDLDFDLESELDLDARYSGLSVRE